MGQEDVFCLVAGRTGPRFQNLNSPEMGFIRLPHGDPIAQIFRICLSQAECRLVLLFAITNEFVETVTQVKDERQSS
jgi:hypothetical protein